MKLTFGDLLIQPDDDLKSELLDDWRWLTGHECEIITITRLGDAFLEYEDGSIHFLDTIEGKFFRLSDNYDKWKAALNDREKIQKWFLPNLVGDLLESGKIPDSSQCLSPNLHPVIGGELNVENFEPTDLVVHFSIAGQIHRQAKDLPEGTVIKRFVDKTDE